MGELIEERIMARTAQAEVELVGKGYTPERAQAAVRQCLRWSRRFGAKVSPPIRDQATLDLLEGRLREVETDYLAGLAASPGPEERTDRWAESLRRMGAAPGPELTAAYRQGAQLG